MLQALQTSIVEDTIHRRPEGATGPQSRTERRDRRRDRGTGDDDLAELEDELERQALVHGEGNEDGERERSVWSYRTLILDCEYRPFMVVSWARAFTLIANDRADEVAMYDRTVKSAHQEHLIPAVIRSRGKWRRRSERPKFTKARVFKRDKDQCQYCGKRFPRDKLTVDHIMPKSKGGKLTWNNAATACLKCNQKKGARTPAEAGMTVLNVAAEPDFASFSELWNLSSIPPEWEPYIRI